MLEIIFLGALIIWNTKAGIDEIKYYRGTKKVDLSTGDNSKEAMGCLAVFIGALIPILYIVVLTVGAHRISNEYLLVLLIVCMIYEIVSIPRSISFNAKVVTANDPDKEYLNVLKRKGNLAFDSFNVVEIGTMIWLFIELVSQILH